MRFIIYRYDHGTKRRKTFRRKTFVGAKACAERERWRTVSILGECVVHDSQDGGIVYIAKATGEIENLATDSTLLNR